MADSGMNSSLRIGLVSQLDPANVREWSGIPYFMANSLENRGHQVTRIGPLKHAFPLTLKVAHRVLNSVGRKQFEIGRTKYVAKSLAASATKKMRGQQFDFILCPSSVVAAYLETEYPIVTWEDATFAGMLGYYPGKWSEYSAISIKNRNQLQQRSLDRSILSGYSSEWAAQSAINNYDVDGKRIKVIFSGANIQDSPTDKEIESAIEARGNSAQCNLLFLGVEWYRNGGDLVLQTAEILRQQGIDIAVDIVGCYPPHPVPDYVKLHGLVSKATDDGQAKMRELLLRAHYLFEPSMAECYGLVFADASAFGVPALARATGGIPSVVRNGENGWAFDIAAGPEPYARHILAEFQDRARYGDSARKAKQLFDQSLNWDVAISSLETEVSAVLNSR